MQDLKTENILKVVYNNPTTKEERELALKEYIDLIWKINDLTKEVKELSIPRVVVPKGTLVCTSCDGTGGKVIYDTYLKCKNCNGSGAN